MSRKRAAKIKAVPMAQPITIVLPAWVEKRYRTWHRRYEKHHAPLGGSETFECYLAGVLKNALDKMHDL